jgi:hypothetical protein
LFLTKLSTFGLTFSFCFHLTYNCDCFDIRRVWRNQRGNHKDVYLCMIFNLFSFFFFTLSDWQACDIFPLRGHNFLSEQSYVIWSQTLFYFYLAFTLLLFQSFDGNNVVRCLHVLLFHIAIIISTCYLENGIKVKDHSRPWPLTHRLHVM